MLPASCAPLLFSLILSGLMSFLVSGIATLRAIGTGDNFFNAWVGAWLAAWFFAFPAVMLVTPVARKVVQFLIAKDSSSGQ